MNHEYQYSYEPNVIVSQLSEILDFLDTCYKPEYTMLISELSLCLKDKSNYNLLPYLYILRRYKENELCGQMLLNIYYNKNTM
jgi:hypothetical protein